MAADRNKTAAKTAPRASREVELGQVGGPNLQDRPEGLWNRLLWIMGQLPSVPKTGQMSGGAGSYSFVEESELMALARPLFISAGVYMAVSEVSCDQLERSTRNGPVHDLTRKVVDYTFINVDDPEERFTTRIHAYAQDTLDKGPGKALTAAGKMAVLKALMMPTGNDIEHEEEGVQRTEAEQPQRAQPANRQRQRAGATQRPPVDRAQPPAQPKAPAATLESLTRARELAESAFLPPSTRRDSLEWLDKPNRSEAKTQELIAKLDAVIREAEEEGRDDD